MMFSLSSPNRKVMFYLYLFCNVALFFIYLTGGELGGDLTHYIIENKTYLFVSISLVVFTFVFLNYLITFFSRLRIRTLRSSSTFNSKYIDFFVLCVLSISMLFSVVYGYGRVGVDGSTYPFYVTLFNKFLVPTLLAEIYFFYFYKSNKKLYFINIILFLVLSIYRGFTAAFLHVGFLLIYRLYRQGKLDIKRVFILFTLAVLTGPLIRILKNIIIRSIAIGGDSAFEQSLQIIMNSVDAESYWMLYFIYMQKLFERFESISALYYIIEHSSAISDALYNNQFLPFYLYNWIPQTFEKLLVLNPIYDLTQVYAQKYIANMINSNYAWQMHMGYMGWLFVSPEYFSLYFVYTVLLVFLVAYLTKVIDKDGGVMEFSWFITLSYLGYGWINEYILYVQALGVFLILVALLQLTVSKRNFDVCT